MTDEKPFTEEPQPFTMADLVAGWRAMDRRVKQLEARSEAMENRLANEFALFMAIKDHLHWYVTDRKAGHERDNGVSGVSQTLSGGSAEGPGEEPGVSAAPGAVPS